MARWNSRMPSTTRPVSIRPDAAAAVAAAASARTLTLRGSWVAASSRWRARSSSSTAIDAAVLWRSARARWGSASYATSRNSGSATS